jgi:hypothetical protein
MELRPDPGEGVVKFSYRSCKIRGLPLTWHIPTPAAALPLLAYP